jgi:hypothetical protein
VRASIRRSDEDGIDTDVDLKLFGIKTLAHGIIQLECPRQPWLTKEWGTRKFNQRKREKAQDFWGPVSDVEG